MLPSIALLSSRAMLLFSATSPLEAIEALILAILVIITVFRRDLSSNNTYRPPSTTSSIPSPAAIATSITTTASTISSKGSQLSGVFKVIEQDFMGNYPIDTDTNTSAKTASATLTSLPTHLLYSLLDYSSAMDVAMLGMVNKDYASLFVSGAGDCNNYWRLRWQEAYGDFWSCSFINSICSDKSIPPISNITNYRHFLLEFAFCYPNWLLAGYNLRAKCYVCYEGALFDLSTFISTHPGTPETLTEHSGGDISAIFREIGHSHVAVEVRNRLIATPVPRAIELPASITAILNQQQEAAKQLMATYMSLGGPLGVVIEDIDHIQTCFTSEYACPSQEHIGEPRVYFQPIARVWCGWCSFCCQGCVLMRGGLG